MISLLALHPTPSFWVQFPFFWSTPSISLCSKGIWVTNFFSICFKMSLFWPCSWMIGFPGRELKVACYFPSALWRFDSIVSGTLFVADKKCVISYFFIDALFSLVVFLLILAFWSFIIVWPTHWALFKFICIYLAWASVYFRNLMIKDLKLLENLLLFSKVLAFIHQLWSRGQYSMAHGQIWPLPVFANKFYWNTAMLTCSHIIYGYFCTITAELTGCDRAYMIHKA